MLMRRRMIARRVVGVAATTAVVAGTAGAVRHHQDQKYANQAADQQADAQADQTQQQLADQQAQINQLAAQQAPQQYAPPPAAPAQVAAPAAPDLNTQLMDIAKLHTAGVLTDEEFAQAKAKLLAGG